MNSESEREPPLEKLRAAVAWGIATVGLLLVVTSEGVLLNQALEPPAANAPPLAAATALVCRLLLGGISLPIGASLLGLRRIKLVVALAFILMGFILLVASLPDR